MTTRTDSANRTPFLLAGIALALIAAVIALVLAIRPATVTVTSFVDGMVVEVEDGLLYFLWDGGRQRIQQPAALTTDDLDALNIRLGDPAPPVLTVGEEGSRFVMYPADGDEARLHLLDGDTAHPVIVTPMTAQQATSLPDLDRLVVTSVRVP